MAPHKAKARANHPPPPQPSDYETDAAPAAVDVPLPPPRSNEELNFAVLRRVYPELLTIEHVTPYAALYTFNLETQQWEKVGVEGTLFVCQLTPSPIGVERYCVVIHNRRGLENFYLDLTSSDDMEITDPYVILQGDEVVYGIWIFADPPPASTANCRVETANKMMEIADRARASREAKEREGDNGVEEATEQVEAASSAPMGRQLSLRELFSQQREQDASFGVHNHSSQPMPNSYPQQGYMPAQNPGPAQQDVLGNSGNFAAQDKKEDDNAVEVVEAGRGGDSSQDSQVRRFARARDVCHNSWTILRNTTRRRREREADRGSPTIAYLIYDLGWNLLRCIAMFIAMWMASHAEDMDQWKGYLLLCINLLFLDTIVKDVWYGSLKKGCKCTCPDSSAHMPEGRSLVV